MATATYLRNIGPVSSLSKYPFEILTRKKLTVDNCQVFGCKVFVLVDKKGKAGKMGARRWVGVFVGYSQETSGVRMWDPTSNKVFSVGKPLFDENVEGGWWRGQQVGKKGKVFDMEGGELVDWPDLVEEPEVL